MKKAVKQTLIWGTTLAVAAGVAVAIAIPVVNAKNKTTSTDPMKNFDSKAPVIEGLTGDQLLAALDEAGIKDSSLVSKTQYQLASYLYNKEQEGSIKLQRLYFQWDLYSMNKSVVDFIKTTLHFDGALSYTDASGTAVTSASISDVKIDASQELFKALVALARAHVDSDADTAKGQNSSLDTFETNWNKKQALVTAIGTDEKTVKIDYNSTSFSSDYPKVLLPLSNIRDKQQKIYDEAKSSFIGSYSGKSEGNAEWQKQISSKYGGATSDVQAVDYLVNQQVAGAAWNKYKFAINKDFTFEQFKSNIFKDILGTASVDANGIWTVAHAKSIIKVTTDKANYNDNDKVYFFGTSSRNPEDFNIMGDDNFVAGSTTETKLNHAFGSNANIMKVQNAILGIKQDASNPLAPWTVTKDQLTKMFSAFRPTQSSVSRPADQWGSLFATGQDELTKQMVGKYTDTTDGTQWKSGDLGWQTQLSGLSGFYEGFSLGLASALDSLSTTPTIGGTVDGKAVTLGSGTTSMNMMSALTSQLSAQLKVVATQKGWKLPAGVSAWDALPANLDAQKISDYNKAISQFITSLTDDEIKQYFGTAIRDFFASMVVDKTTGVASKVGDITATDALDGLPSAIRIDDKSATGVGIFMVNADQMGMHLIKVETGTAAADAMIKELQADASSLKQDGSLIVTDWGKFISDSYSTAQQLVDVLGVDYKVVAPAKPAVGNTELADILKGKLADLGYQTGEEDKMLADVAALVSSIKNSEGLAKVQSGYRDALFTWLQDKIDKKLWTSTDSVSITPEEIYGAHLTAEGVK